MKSKIINQASNYKSSLFNGLKEIYIKISGEKNKERIPKTLLKLSNELLALSPNTFLFKTVEIKEFSQTPDKELTACFPENYFINEDNVLKKQIFEYLLGNLGNYNDNSLIVDGIKNIMDQIPANTFHKKYDKLIFPLTKNMNVEEGTLCRLLVTCPLKYKELTYQVISCLNSSPLPKKASDFYSIKNYTKNEKNLKDSNSLQKVSKDEFQKLKDEFNKAMRLQNDKIQKLEFDVSSLKKELKITKNSLFQNQVRDVIKEFIKQIKWSFHIYQKGDILDLIKPILKRITDGKSEEKKEGAKKIIDLLEKLGKMKLAGDDKGHTLRNEGFKVDILPEDIHQRYDLYKKTESKCSILGCDCIALILAIKEINNSTQAVTQKKYNLFENIFNVPLKNKEHNFEKITKLLLSY